jgi:glycosyltransferase involved in cell wall biosynthesis
MTSRANQRSVRSILRSAHTPKKLNILTACAHERYEQNLCKTGHNFYSLAAGKTWDTDYGDIPENYHIIDSIPDYIDFDLILAHTDDQRLAYMHSALSGLQSANSNKTHVPILRHNHVLPDVRFDVEQQKKMLVNPVVNFYSFISRYSMEQWGFNENNSAVIEHGVDTEFWNPGNEERNNVCLSVVNDWPNRDWCCGWNLWQQTAQGLPLRVYGKSPGLSEPAESTEHLRQIYQKSKIFYNTSLHSPVPSVLLEAMACGCAIVTTGTCMIPEIIQNGHNGLMSNDPKELRSYLEMLLQNDHIAKQLGENARKTIEERFKLDRFVNTWNRAFEVAIKSYRGQ